MSEHKGDATMSTDPTIERHFIGQNTASHLEPIRAWQLNEVDIVAARSLPEAIEWYERTTGLRGEEAVDPDHFRELELHRLAWCEDQDGDRFQCTLHDLISSQRTFPCILCSYSV